MHKYYAILGLKYGASTTEIKKAYYKLSKELHPDVNPSEEAITAFVKLNEAYEILLKIKSHQYTAIIRSQKKVSKEWLEAQKKKAKFEAARKMKMERESYLKSIKHETFSKDAFKVIRTYFLTLFFLFLVIYSSYTMRPDDETFPKERLYLFIKVIFGITTAIYIVVFVNFYNYYKKD
jgi:cation transport ATPase